MATALDPDEVLRSTKGKENFQRITRLLISGGTTLLREVFDMRCPPSDLPRILMNPVTRSQLKLAKLTKPQLDCLYPSPGVYGKSADFHVTLLFRLLSTICNLTPPATGWAALPAVTDHSLTADLVRIKCYRNNVYGLVYQNMEITDDEFPLLWREISGALVRIAGQINTAKKDEWQVAIDNFLKAPLTVGDERNEQVYQTIPSKTGSGSIGDYDGKVEIESTHGDTQHQSIDRLTPSSVSPQLEGDTALSLCGEVVESVLTQSCDAKEVVLQLKECLQLDQTSLQQPETKNLIRCLARRAKSSDRLDVVKHLRKITPAGTTGPLLEEHLNVRDIPFHERRELTIDLSGGDEWKMVAEALGLTPRETRFLDNRILNPFDAALAYIANQRNICVGYLYDLLNECGLPVIADLL